MTESLSDRKEASSSKVLVAVLILLAFLASTLGATLGAQTSTEDGLSLDRDDDKDGDKKDDKKDDKKRRRGKDRDDDDDAEIEVDDDDDDDDDSDGNDDDDDDDDDDDEKKSKTRVFESEEEKYVYENLKDFLVPTTLKWLDDGRVEMTFAFGKKLGDHESIFSLPIGNKQKDKFRWTVGQEEFVVGGIPGIRVSDRGLVMLRAWYTGDVEAEVGYRQYINLSKRHLMAVIYQNEKGSALGSNYGNQVAMFSKGRLKGKSKEKIKGVVFDATARIGLKVTADGVFEAHRDGYLSAKSKYKTKSFPRGQIGMVWAGSIAGIVGNLKVTGKIDYKRMKEEMKKRRSGRRR